MQLQLGGLCVHVQIRAKPGGVTTEGPRPLVQLVFALLVSDLPGKTKGCRFLVFFL